MASDLPEADYTINSLPAGANVSTFENTDDVHEDSETESFVDALEDLQQEVDRLHGDVNVNEMLENVPDQPQHLERDLDPTEQSSDSAQTESNHSSPDCESFKKCDEPGLPSHDQTEAEGLGHADKVESANVNFSSRSVERDTQDTDQVVDDVITEALGEGGGGGDGIAASADSASEPVGSGDEEPDEPSETVIDEEVLKEREAKMTPEEKEAKRAEAQVFKVKGNDAFKAAEYQSALEAYTEALMICPLCHPKDRSIMYSNRSAAKLKLDRKESSIKDCSKALELHPHYLKALLRRAELYEQTDKLDEALADYQKAITLDPSLHAARAACMRLPDQIKERNEKMKAEMMSKLKDLGNMVLRPFGLSTENFNLQQDPNTGSYSVQFNQKGS